MDNKIDYIEILKQLEKESSFLFQYQKLSRLILLPAEQITKIYNMLCADLTQCFHTRFRGCRVWPFGSTMTGTAFHTSDVDMYVEVIYPVTLRNPKDNPSTTYVLIAKGLLTSWSKFSNVMAIPNAKTPIVRCVHVPTGVSCDINFKSMLGVYNTQLIKFLLDSDARLRPVLILLKFWSAAQNIPKKLTNYSLTMMLFFYLQNIEKSIIPPIGLLQFAPFIAFQEGWNGGFCNDPQFLLSQRKYVNGMSIPELLRGFFQFYAVYDYGFNVICPFLGQSVEKTHFNNLDALSDRLFHYKNMVKREQTLPIGITELCIQDPFELAHNITKSIRENVLEEFKEACVESVVICDLYKDAEHLLLPNLLKQYERVTSPLTAMFNNCSFTLQVGDSLKYLDASKTSNPRNLWLDTVNDFFLAVLDKIFALTVTKEDIEMHKVQKVNKEDVHNQVKIKEETVTYQCKGYHNIWDTRKSIAKNLNHIKSLPENRFDRERTITDYVVNDLCKGVKISEPVIDFSVTYYRKLEPTCAEFIFTNNNLQKYCSFKQMGTFVKNYFTLLFNQYLGKHYNPPQITEKEEKKCELDIQIKVET